MNRIEIVSLFTALDHLCEKGDIEGVQKIVKATLDEARSTGKRRSKNEKDEEE